MKRVKSVMPMPEQKGLKFLDFVVDPAAASLMQAGVAIPLRPKSFDVLLYLARNPGRVVSKNELMQFIWSDVTVTDNSLVQCIGDVRKALDDDAQEILKTVARRGYLFAAMVIEGAIDEPVPMRQASDLPTTPRPLIRSRPPYLVLAAVAAFLVAVVGVYGWSHNFGTRDRPPSVAAANAPEPVARSARIPIAVLPFVTLGEPLEKDYFARGLTEDVISALGRFPELTVRSINAVLHYQDKSINLDTIKRELNVRYFSSGTIRRSPERIRVSIQLADAQSGTLLWADQYDRDPADIFAIQDDIARRITGALAVRLTNAEQTRVAAKSPDKLEAYEFVLRGRHSLLRLTRSATSEARLMFERAVELDPNYAAAYLGLGVVDLRMVHHGWTPDPAMVLDRALNHAYTAIASDEFNPQGHALLGRIFARMREYVRSVNALKRAMAINPSDPSSYAGLGDALLWSGDIHGAIEALEVADQSDPQLSTQDLFNLGAAYFLFGDHTLAAHVYERAAARNEGNSFVQAMLAAIYQDAGRPDDARRAMIEVRRLNPFFDMDTFGSLLRNPEHRRKIMLALQKASA